MQNGPWPNPGEAIRAARSESGWWQRDLADKLGVTQVFVSQMERGKVELPSADVRQRLARELGFDPYREVAAARVGKISLAEAARRHRVDVHDLIRLVQEGAIQSPRFLGNGKGYEVDEEQFAAEIAALWRCRYDGCDEPGVNPSGCCGAHGHALWALEAKGKKQPVDRCRKIQQTKRENPSSRPDSKERLAGLHAQADAEAAEFEQATALYGRERAADYLHLTASGFAALELEPRCVKQFAIGRPRPFFAETVLRDRRRLVARAEDEAGPAAWPSSLPLDPARAVEVARASGRLTVLTEKLGSSEAAIDVRRADR
jgi:transcriptional regulator with XRE-family HTH domain